MTTHKYHAHYAEQSAYAQVTALVRDCFGREGVLLDVGCGFGAVAETCRDFGYTYIGLDVDPSGLADLANRGFEVHEVCIEPTKEFDNRLSSILADRPLGGFLMLNFLEHLIDAGDVLHSLRDVAASHDAAPLVLCVPNISHLDVCAKLLQGRWDYTEVGILDRTHVGFYNEVSLTSLAELAGWREIAKADFCLENSDQHFPPDNVALLSGTPLNSALRHIRDQSSPGGNVYQFVRTYVPGPRRPAASQPPEEAPFLSVLTRTQGTRLETLQETILCLTAQSCQDFEVLLLAHNVTPEQADHIRYLTDSLSPAVSWRFRIIPVTGPGRCRPLNVGVKEARGRYVAVLDDDDLVMGNWVETFRDLSCQWPGRVLRAVVAEQDVSRGQWPDRAGYNAVSGIRTPFPSAFDLFNHLAENHSPPCGLAFPRSCFRDLGIVFDESLPVLEDWDVLLQAALLCGVASSENVTSIYRRWKIGWSSMSVHTRTEWDNAHRAIIAKLDRRPCIFPPGSITGVRDLQRGLPPGGNTALEEELAKIRGIFESTTSWRVTRPLRAAGDFARSIRRKVK